MGLLYLGSDSGVFQNEATFNLLTSVFDPRVRTDLLKSIGFDRHYHSAGRDVLVRTQAGLKYRHGIDVGNGKGVHFMDTSHSKEGLWVHKAKVMLEEWRRKGEKTKRASSGGVPIADSVIDPKYLITPRHIFHISGSVPASKVGIPGAKGSAQRSKGP